MEDSVLNFKEPFGKLKDIGSNIFNTISGDKIIDSTKEYFDIYGEILVGMHNELQSQNQLIQDYKNDIEAKLDELKSLLDNTKVIQERVSRDCQVIENYKNDIAKSPKTIMDVQKVFQEVAKKLYFQVKTAIWLAIFAIMISIGVCLWTIVLKN